MKVTKVHEDKRGSVYIIEDKDLGCSEMTIHFTKKGFARGGCVHKKSNEHFAVINGEITFVNGNITFLPSSGHCFLIAKNTPHYFVSNSDSVVLEWGAGKDDKKTKDREYRKIVNEINTANRT